jgi:hypothetical protein
VSEKVIRQTIVPMIVEREEQAALG